MYGAWDQRFQMWGKTSKNKFINMAVKLHDFSLVSWFGLLFVVGSELRSEIEKWPISHIVDGKKQDRAGYIANLRILGQLKEEVTE